MDPRGGMFSQSIHQFHRVCQEFKENICQALNNMDVDVPSYEKAWIRPWAVTLEIDDYGHVIILGICGSLFRTV